MFGTSVALDKYFQIVAESIKNKSKANYSRNLEKFARKTGLVLRNNAFAIRKVELTDDNVQELRKSEIFTYNQDFMKDRHFVILADAHKDFFVDEGFEEIDGTYYIYILQDDDFIKNNSKTFYEICMTSNVSKTKTKNVKNDDELTEEIEEEKIFEVSKQNGRLEMVQVKDWQIVTDKCELFKIFTERRTRFTSQRVVGTCYFADVYYWRRKKNIRNAC